MMKAQHNIIKIISKSGYIRDFKCNEHNTSYPTLESVKTDHPNLDETKIIPFFKNGHGVQTPTIQNISDNKSLGVSKGSVTL